MILLRGIKGDAYAKKIQDGIVDCRDILSALLMPPVTGYEYSDYYEKNMVKALAYFSDKWDGSLQDPSFLFSLLIDFYIPHIYLTYFHVLNENSIEWLSKFEDDYSFIAIEPKIDRVTKTLIGDEFFGAKMEYVDDISQLSQDVNKGYYAACMCSIEDIFANKKDMIPSLKIYNTLSFPLLCREQDEKFTDIENEFRVIAYDCPRVNSGRLIQKQRPITIMGASGTKYEGILKAPEDTEFSSNLFALSNPQVRLSEIVEMERGRMTIDSCFKQIDIRGVAKDYRYIGDKNACKEYIVEMLEKKPRDVFVNRIVIRKRKIDKLKDVEFFSSHDVVDYDK